MRDPHVERLHYRIGSGADSLSFVDPEPQSFENILGRFDTTDGQATACPAEHFASEQDARTAIEPFFRAWEISADLKSDPGPIKFTFHHADVIDRNPLPPGSAAVFTAVGTGEVLFVGAAARVQITSPRYPAPPSDFRTTTEVEVAYRRWLGYREGKEPLQSMAYFVYTLATGAAGGKKGAAKMYAIQEDVLGKLSELSSTRGGNRTRSRRGVSRTGSSDSRRFSMPTRAGAMGL